MSLNIRTQALLLSVVPLTAMVVVLAFALLNTRSEQSNAYWGRHSQDVLAASAAITASAGAANSALVEYLRNHNRTALTRMRTSLRELVSHSTNLEVLVADNPTQEARAQHIAHLVQMFVPVFNELAGASATRQRQIQQSRFVQQGGRDFTAAQAALERDERSLAIHRFQQFSSQSALFTQSLVIALVLGIALTVLTMLLFGWRLVRRLRLLSENADRLARGEETLALGGHDEIAQLDEQYRKTALQMRREHAISTQLQRALLPQQLPAIAGIRIDASYRPASSAVEIGGDWYDIFILGDHTIGISIGDVAGHGLLAASTMALVRQSIQTAARYTHDAAAVLELVNRQVVDQNIVVSAFFGIFNTHDGSMQYAVAGHPAPITIRATGTVGMLAGEGIVLGVERQARFDRYDTILESGAALVLYTDGLVETFRGDYSRGVSRLIDAISSEYYSTSENIAQAIQNRVFSGIEPHDDSALVFLGITELGASGASLTRTWGIDAKSVSEARRLKRALLWHLGQYSRSEDEFATVELILGELLGNVARHTAGSAIVTLEIDHEDATLHVSDSGEPIDGVPEQFDAFAESGRGLFLVQALSKELRIDRHGTGNRVSAILPIALERSPAAKLPKQASGTGS